MLQKNRKKKGNLFIFITALLYLFFCRSSVIFAFLKLFMLKTLICQYFFFCFPVASKPLFNSALWAVEVWPLKRLRKEHRYSCCIQRWELRLQKQQYPLIPVENTFILNGLISHIVNWVPFRPTSKLIIIVYLLPYFANIDPTVAIMLLSYKVCVYRRTCVPEWSGTQTKQHWSLKKKKKSLTSHFTHSQLCLMWEGWSSDLKEKQKEPT